jgi:hypothetical protein
MQLSSRASKRVTFPSPLQLGMSRSIGDYPLKKSTRKLIIAEPEVVHEVVKESTSFIILASDGLWDIIAPQEVRSTMTHIHIYTYTCIFLLSLLLTSPHGSSKHTCSSSLCYCQRVTARMHANLLFNMHLSRGEGIISPLYVVSSNVNMLEVICKIDYH